VITASILVWQALHRPAPLPAPVLTQLTFDSGLTTDPAVSPDGKLMAFASDRAGQGNLDIWLQQLATGQAARLTQDAADESEPAFSRDGSQIAFRSERQGGGIYLIPAIGGEPRLIAKEGRRPRFSADGMHVAYWIGDWYVGRVLVAPAAGGTPVPFQGGFASAMFPVWSSDGKQILFLGARKPEEAANDGFEWWIAPAAGGDAVQTGAYAIFRREKLIHGWPALVFPYDWAANEVFFSATLGATTNLWRVPLSSTSWKATGAPQRLTSGTALETKPSVSSGGTIAFSNLSSQLNIWGIPIDANRGKVTGELERLTHAAHDAHTSLSANGRTLVFLSTRAGNPDVWMKDLVSGKETALTATPQHEEQPDITRDGAMVSYMINENGVSSIYMMPAGGGVPEKIGQDCPRPWDWSPDGRHMLYLSLPSGRMTLSLLNVAARQKRDLITHPKYELARARFSPDGRWISASGSEQLLLGRNRMVVMPFRPDAPVADSEWVWITSDESYHDKGRWSPDGNLLYYTSDRDGYRCIRAQQLEPATKRPVGEPFDVYHSHSARRSLKNAGVELMEISVASDRLVFNLGESTGNIWMAKFGEER
jgi:Tol biopolymer transport system component